MEEAPFGVLGWIECQMAKLAWVQGDALSIWEPVVVVDYHSKAEAGQVVDEGRQH